MEKLVITGGTKLHGQTNVSGAKNVALKALVAACMTADPVIIENIPLISDLFIMADIIRSLGGTVTITGHTAKVRLAKIKKPMVSLDAAAEIRTSVMFLPPLLAREKKAIIPNPGGCRIGARPIDRTIQGLQSLGANILYDSSDGYFHATTEGLVGTTYHFDKNTHTGTETLILAAVLAKGRTVLENAAQEPEIDELIAFLNAMGANIIREQPRTIVIEGVEKLHGTTFRIGADRNEVITLAIAAVMTGGDITVSDVDDAPLAAFLEKFREVGGGYEKQANGLRFFAKGPIQPTDVTTNIYPGFMTDWQAPWTVFMTMAHGTSLVHETIYENRFAYVEQLLKMGAQITLFNPPVSDPETFYNFNYTDGKDTLHAAKITGPSSLHNAVVTVTDLRAGATLVLAAVAAKGQSVVFGIEHLDRGYERLDQRLNKLGAKIKRVAVE